MSPMMWSYFSDFLSFALCSPSTEFCGTVSSKILSDSLEMITRSGLRRVEVSHDGTVDGGLSVTLQPGKSA